MSKKALFITRKWQPAVGGMETYSQRLSEELARLTNLEIIALPGRPDGRPPLVFSLCWFGGSASFRVLRNANRFDVIHGGDLAIWPLVWLACLRAPKARLILSTHGSDIAYANRKGVRAWLYRRYLGLGVKLLKDVRILANSCATASLCEARGFKHVTVIPLAAEAAAQEAPVAAPEPYIFFAGRLVERKGCGWFIRNVLPLLPGCMTLKVAGAVVDESERHALDHERVEHLGAVFGDALAVLRRNAIAVVVPNIVQANAKGFEGFGLVAVEGAAEGGVVLASATDGIVDAVIDGETGFLLPPGDAHAWAKKIEEIAGWDADRRKAFANQAKRAVRECYSWARVAADTFAQYGAKMDLTLDAGAKPLISVVMPAYNAERYIDAAVNSILKQTLGDFEFLIIDDCSTDATPQMLARAAERDARIRVLRNASNQGVTRSLNRGLEEARGRYLARMDADDISLPERFAKQVAFLEANSDFSFVGAGYQVIDAEGRFLKTDIEATESWECSWISMFRMPVTHPVLMARRSILADHGLLYDPEYEHAEDLHFIHRLLQYGMGCALPEVLFNYRMHGSNVSLRSEALQRDAKRRAAALNASERFPDIDSGRIDALFAYLNGDDEGGDDIASAADTIKALENAFAVANFLTSQNRKKMRALSIRWLSAAAFRRGVQLQPLRAVEFLWAVRDYFGDAPAEALEYLRRRTVLKKTA